MRKPKRPWKIVRRCLLLILGLWVLLHVFPRPLFAHSVRYRNLTLYSRSPLPANAAEILEKADHLLSSSELYSTNRSRKIFVSDSYALHWLLTFGQRHGVGSSFSMTTGHVFIPKADIANDRALPEQWKPTDTRERPLSSTIAHELEHDLNAEYLGRLSYWRLRRNANWADEGYCDYIARSSSISLEDGVRSVLQTPYETKGLSYFRSRLMVAHLINEQHMSIKDIFRNPPDAHQVSDEVVEELRKNPAIDPGSLEPPQEVRQN
jgi:hypothetical protein